MALPATSGVKVAVTVVPISHNAQLADISMHDVVGAQMPSPTVLVPGQVVKGYAPFWHTLLDVFAAEYFI